MSKLLHLAPVGPVLVLALGAAACGSGDSDPDARPTFDAPGDDGDDDAPPPDARAPDAGEPVEVVGEVFFAGDGEGPRVIVQDGDGPWQVVTAADDGTYPFTVTSGRYGFGEICVDDVAQELVVQFATVTDPPPFLFAGCGQAGVTEAGVPVTGTISGLIGGGFDAQLGNAVASSSTSAESIAYAASPPAGTRDFLFGRRTLMGARVDRIAVDRDVEVTAPMTYDVDFATAGVATELRDLDIPIGESDDGVAFSTYRTANAGSIVTTRTDLEPLRISVPPATQWAAGDLYLTSLSRYQDFFTAYQANVQTFTSYDEIPDPFVVELPAPLVGPIVDVVDDEPTQVRAVTAVAEGATIYSLLLFSFGFDGGCGKFDCFPYWQLDATPAYVGAVAATITTPAITELIALGVFDDRLDLRSGDVAYDLSASVPASTESATLYAGLSDFLFFTAVAPDLRRAAVHGATGRPDPVAVRVRREQLRDRRRAR